MREEYVDCCSRHVGKQGPPLVIHNPVTRRTGKTTTAVCRRRIEPRDFDVSEAVRRYQSLNQPQPSSS